MNVAAATVPYVAPHIELTSMLGSGSMGAVWAARHRDLGDVAVKLIEPSVIAEHPEIVDRLRFEAEAVWRIECPHVTEMHERGVAAGGRPYIVMELLRGQTLEAHIDAAVEEARCTPVHECLIILEQMAVALAAAHEKGIVHRDLKPENVFLCGAETPNSVPFVKLLDFGIAKRPTDDDMQLTRPGTLLGTPYYMSKEQLISSADVDHRADLWAFAVVAYELLTGAVPFVGDNLAYLIRAVFEGKFDPVAALRPRIASAALEAWFATAFDADIDARFQSIEAMMAALRAALPTVEDEVSGIRRIVPDDPSRQACSLVEPVRHVEPAARALSHATWWAMAAVTVFVVAGVVAAWVSSTG